MRAKVVDPRIYFAPRPPQLPFALSIDGQGRTTALLDGGGRNRSVIVCGYLGCDAKPFNPLLASLPRIVRMPGLMGDGGSWIGTFLRSVVEESNRRRQGGEAMLERMSEMMFVEVLRRYVEGMPENQTGWLAGMRDPSIGRALALIHEKPGEAWTVERLGEVAALSRSVLHERFVHFIGQSPIEYLTQWRMQLAAVSLRDTDAKVIEVALEVGYESEAAFSRAFKRAVGESPESAHALGYPVRRIRFLAVIVGGALCGLAGAYLSTVYTPLWVEGMVAGRGWIALALTTFATWRPARVLLGAYLFGGVTMLQFHLQGRGVELPSQLLSALPYLATIVVLVLISRSPAWIRANMPAALGKPFVPGA